MEISYEEYKRRFQLDEYSIDNQPSTLYYYGSFIVLSVSTMFGYAFYNYPQFRRNTIEFCFGVYDYCYDKFYNLWYDDKVRVVISRIHSHSDKTFKVLVLKKIKQQELKNQIAELYSSSSIPEEADAESELEFSDIEDEEYHTEESPADESPADESPEDESPEDESPADESNEDESPEDESPEDESHEDESPEDESNEDESNEDESNEDGDIHISKSANDILIDFFESDLIFHHVSFKEFDYYIIDNYLDHHFKFSGKNIIDFPWLSATLEIKTDTDFFSYEISNKLKYYWVKGNKLPLSIDYYNFWLTELTDEKLPSHNDIKMISLTVIDENGEFNQFSEVLILPEESKTLIIDFPFSK